jgi:hypothetical protein
MIKDYKAVALKQSAGTGANTYTFIVKGQNQKEATINAQNYILNTYSASANYHVSLELIGNSLLQ